MQDSLECIVLEWVSTPINDMLADSVLACILQIEACPTGAFGKRFAVLFAPDALNSKEAET